MTNELSPLRFNELLCRSWEEYRSYPPRRVTDEEVLDYMEKQLKDKQQKRATLDAEIYLLEITIDYVEKKKAA